MSAQPFAGRRVVGLFPHPDDEAYAAGGTLALCAQGGAEVTVVCATRGEAGADRSGGVPPGAELAALRSRELVESCRILGVAAPLFLDWPDGAVDTLRRDVAARTLNETLRRLHPDVVLMLGEDGVYGCVDHRACTDIAMRAVSLAGAETTARILHCAFPRGLFEPVRRALRRGATASLVDSAAGELGTTAAAVHLRVNIESASERKLAALAAHRSQLRRGDPDTFLRPGLIRTLLVEEWFVVRGGPPLPRRAADPFAGLPCASST